MRKYVWLASLPFRFIRDIWDYRNDFRPRQIVWYYWRYISNSRLRNVYPGQWVEFCDYSIHKAVEVDLVGDTVVADTEEQCSLFHCGVVAVSEPKE